MKTLVSFIEHYSNQYAAHPFMWEKNGRDDIRPDGRKHIDPAFTRHVDPSYHPLTYAETLDKVYEFGAGLMALGVEPGDRVALLSEGRADWVISEMGILFNGAINVPLSVKLSPVELQFRLFHSGASRLIVSENHYEKVMAVRSNLPELQQIILLNKREQYKEDEISKNQVVKMGRQLLEKRKNAFIKRKDQVEPDTPANISYTSGTTADPKGIILTHRNYTANVEQALTLMDIPPTYRTLLILPLDHSFAHTAGVYSFMAKGASIGMVQAGKTVMETLRNIPVNMKEFKPNLLLSVPALAKSFKKNIESAIRSKGPVIQRLFEDALQTAYAYNREGYNKRTGDIYRKAKLLLYDVLLFKKIRENFGGQLDFFIGGGALLDIELQRFFYAIGLPMMQGYGLSEATPIISSNSLKRHKLGSSGHLVHPLELKIVDEEGKELPTGTPGEIIIKGENVMKGYWKNPTATRETIRDGWLYTGDLGYMDEDGFLYVSGRFKSLLIGHDGEKYSPESIEETITEKSGLIEQLMLHNNQDPYTIGLLYPSAEALKRTIKKQKDSKKTEKEAALSDEDIDAAIDALRNELNEYHRGGRYGDLFPDRWLPSAVGLLSEGFNEQNKMMNSTMKMVRGKIEEHHEELIQYLYLPEARAIHNEKNREAIRKLLES
ncbi:AMP-binding protein [Balneolaceae bacterium ANBcel3]|nr:AMP-binding protein [Balneolaceae bacterium ANBcel3]